jgi:hypothetical protein
LVENHIDWWFRRILNRFFMSNKPLLSLENLQIACFLIKGFRSIKEQMTSEENEQQDIATHRLIQGETRNVFLIKDESVHLLEFVYPAQSTIKVQSKFTVSDESVKYVQVKQASGHGGKKM